jgi:cardiolipin synthase A/B
VSGILSPWWMFGLALIGVLALATGVIKLFFALGRRPQELSAEHLPRLDDEDGFLLALTGAINAPTRAGGSIRLLNNGDEFFPVLLEEIRAARTSITFFTYIFDDGEVGSKVLESLIDRARAGVTVRLLLDGFGGMGADSSQLEALREAGGRVHVYRPLHLGKLTRFHKRNHRRAIVIDGRVGFTGGSSIADKWLGDADRPDHWRDMMFRVTGPLALSLQTAFGEAWSNTYGEILAGTRFFPTDDPEPERSHPAELHDVGRHVNLISSPADEAHPVRKLFWISFRAARERIYLTTSYFVPDALIRAALRECARTGVDVRLLLPNEHIDAKPVWYASRSYYEELLADGIRIFEYQPTFLHSKALVVDGRWSVIGSANQDVRSKELNEENVLGILDPRFGAELERVFLSDLERSREIQLDEWRRRGIWERLKERFFVLLAEQY